MEKLLIATNNPAKLGEYAEILAGSPFKLTSLGGEGITEEVAETGATFAENARLKASAYAKMSGFLTLADDSGLEVRALGGEPGVQSKRYAGENATDFDRIHFLLDRMRSVPLEKRQARFCCVIAIATATGAVSLCRGTVAGLIAFEPRGGFGFGYDPVFYLPDYGRTMAEMLPAEKNRISHRGQAGKAARVFLTQLAPVGD
ncbi:MAG: RdgB/HAM1 family non-canonical purine NTP pyrophosphatase [Chloroflexi bacterium]|nr:RdgB/HAM1 family non-canonical purine NTP pyrophosphatase [Chloroflexota bacterium]